MKGLLNLLNDVEILLGNCQKQLPILKTEKQLIRSSGSIGANYLEASESLSKKDFYMRIKISRKEAKESRYWLKLVYANENESLVKESRELIQEATELMKIFGSIVTK